MNKQDLINHLKQSTASIDEILTAGNIPLDAEDYSPEQVQTVEEINHLVETKQVKTYKEAGNLYRKGQNEHQLNEIALRHAINTEQIPEILKALKLKAESLTEQQFEAFREVCLAVQSGIDLSLAAQASLNKVKGSKAKATPKAETAIAKASGSNGSAIAETTEAEVITLPDALPNQEQLRETARREAAIDQSGFAGSATEAIFDASDQILDRARSLGRQLYFEELQASMSDPDAIAKSQAAIDEVVRRRRPERQH